LPVATPNKPKLLLRPVSSPVWLIKTHTELGQDDMCVCVCLSQCLFGMLWVQAITLRQVRQFDNSGPSLSLTKCWPKGGSVNVRAMFHKYKLSHLTKRTPNSPNWKLAQQIFSNCISCCHKKKKQNLQKKIITLTPELAISRHCLLKATHAAWLIWKMAKRDL